jgi:hypothetical protein
VKTPELHRGATTCDLLQQSLPEREIVRGFCWLWLKFIGSHVSDAKRRADRDNWETRPTNLSHLLRRHPPYRSCPLPFNASVPHDMHRGAVVDPLVDEFGGIAAVEGDADAAVGCGVIGDGGEAVDENVAVDLDAPWHGGVVEEF